MKSMLFALGVALVALGSATSASAELWCQANCAKKCRATIPTNVTFAECFNKWCKSYPTSPCLTSGIYGVQASGGAGGGKKK